MRRPDDPPIDPEAMEARRAADARRTLEAQWAAYSALVLDDFLREFPDFRFLLQTCFYSGASSVLGILGDLQRDPEMSSELAHFVLSYVQDECLEMGRRTAKIGKQGHDDA